MRQRSDGPSYRRAQGPRKPKPKECFFCVNNIINIDYKDAELLHKFISSHAKIAPTRRSGVCSWHQRKLSAAIKHARQMALLPFVVK